MRLHSFSRDNKMIVSCIVSVFLLVLPNPLFSQDLDSNVLILEKTKNLFQEKNYSGAIEEADKGLALYDNQEKDITYVSLLEYKALAYNWLHDNRSAMPIYKEAVTTFCKIKGDNRMSCSMSKNFVSIYMSSGWEAYQDSVFVLCLHNIFKKNCISDDTSYWDNLRYYKYYILSLTGYHSYNVDLDAEYSFASKTNNPTLVEYVNYAKGYWKIHGRLGVIPTIKEKNNGISILERTAQHLTRLDNSAGEYLLNEIYYEIAQAADELEEYELATVYYRKMIDLASLHWIEWRYKHLWANPRIGGRMGKSGLEPYCILDNYLEAMSKANMNADIISYCGKVLLDPLFNEIEYPEWYKVTVLEAQRSAYQKLGKKKDVDRIDSKLNDIYNTYEDEVTSNSNKDIDADSMIVLYQNNTLSEEIINSIISPSFVAHYWPDYTPLYEHLETCGDYKLLEYVTNRVYNYYWDSASTFNEHYWEYLEDSSLFTQQLDYYWRLINDSSIFKIDQNYFARIAGLRDTWLWAMGSHGPWKTIHYLVRANWQLGNLDRAIHYQKMVVDIVSLDGLFGHERNSYFERGPIGDYGFPFEYFCAEQDMYDWLAFFYKKKGDYKNSYMCYKMKLDAIRDIIEDQIVYGANSIKYKNWESWNWYISDIIASIADYTDNYPPFADLILECNTLIKGFMFNIHTETYNVAHRRHGEILYYYYQKDLLEKELERYYYYGGNGESELKEQISRLSIELNDTIGFPTIVHNAWQDFSNVEKKLGDNDVLVDFFAVDYSNNVDIEKEVVISFYTLENGYTAQITQTHKYSNPTFYATIMRKGWQHPKVVNLGQLASTTFADGKDLIDHLYYQSEYRTDINTIYRNTTFGAKIWGEVMEKGLVKRGDNIYFCPTSYLNDIAVEYLQDATGSVMSDQYNMYRISTIREMDKPRIGFKKGDKCVAFGNIAYSKTADKKNKRSTKTRKPINMASIPEAMTDRVILDELEPTQDILTIISKKISKAVIVSGVDATEESFYNLSGNSPDILVIATHGYNYEREGLNDEQEKYLYGNRDNTLLSTQERSMYKSGLFMAQSPNDIPTNGMLTAKEISMCDLHNTKLAIIAACVSAVGNNTEEGVFGIQRGLKMAGVQSMLVSLWEVDADATKLLIEEFLKQYVKGNDAHESLRMAQQYVRSYESKDKKLMGDKHIYQSPYYWAGFILID